MHSVWIRVNAVFFFGLGVLGMLAFCNVMTIKLGPPLPAPKINMLEVYELRRLAKFRRGNRAILTLNLDIDISPLWNWNVKQIFVFVSADYKGAVNKRNSVVLFDQIIERLEDTRIQGKDIVKYPLYEEDEDLRDMPVQLKLGYDIHPLFGPLSLYGTGRIEIPFEDPRLGYVNYTFPTVYN